MTTDTLDAADFTIELANGPAIVLSELWREHYLLLWFSRGLVCPFCRRQMVQLAQIADELRRHDTVAVQITMSELETARRLLELFPVAWPYACDPGGRVAAAYGLEGDRSALAALATTVTDQARAWGVLLRHPAEPHPEVLRLLGSVPPPAAHEGGMAIVDRNGKVRFKQGSGHLSLLPSNAQILQAVRQVVSDSR